MNGDLFGKMFARRTAYCFFVIMALLFSCILRVAVTATGSYAAVQKSQTSYKLKAGNIRGTIYDCNRIPITNNKAEIIAAAAPTPRGVSGICHLLSDEEREDALDRLKSGKPITFRADEKTDYDGISYTTVYRHNSADMPAVHIIGYTDSDGHGVTGLEAAYDDILYCQDDAAFVYTLDGSGEIIDGIEPEIQNNSSAVAAGVVSTIDINIQNIAENAANSLEKGAVVICEPESGKIRAMVSRPDFDCTAVYNYLKADNSPLLNRALSAYNVGSVFKPCVAAAGIESGHGGFCYTCTGSCQIVDRMFNCHKRSGHGDMNLESAVAYSCNTFFYNFSALTGAKAIYNMASSLGFSGKQKLCQGIYTDSPTLPTLDALENPANLANLSIGQGRLLLSPVSILTLYCAAASDGTYRRPSIIEGTVAEGTFTPYDAGKQTRVMSPDTAKTLRECLLKVTTEGTGTAAMPKTVTAAGKTATAQTGHYAENGTEICEGWFCGYFPAENPRYTVAVFSEDISKQSKTCAEIFADIADAVAEYKQING